MTQFPMTNSMQRQTDDLAKQIAMLQQWQNMAQPGTIAPVLPPEQIKSVKGVDGAKAYLKNMGSNSSAILLDQDVDAFYILKKDANGLESPIVLGRFTLEQVKDEAPEYITKSDFLELKKELVELIKGKEP